MLWFAGYVQAFLVFLRFILNLLNFIPAAVCLYYSTPIEHCRVNNTSHNILGQQKLSNAVNAIGTLVEDGNSLLLLNNGYLFLEDLQRQRVLLRGRSSRTFLGLVPVLRFQRFVHSLRGYRAWKGSHWKSKRPSSGSDIRNVASYDTCQRR